MVLNNTEDGEIAGNIARSTSWGRWAGVGPYYAMFPLNFSFNVIRRFSHPGDQILDPFAGRASSVFAAAALGRKGYGIEVNPVGWLYGKVKLRPAPLRAVLSRANSIIEKSHGTEINSLGSLSKFFSICYSPKVLKFLLAARGDLDWRNSQVDATLMALILVYLHGKRGASLSNQMRQSKAMSPEYAIKWWENRRSTPPDMDLKNFLTQRIYWRYVKGRHNSPGSSVILGDSTKVLSRLEHQGKRFNLLFTSPPYYNVTNYHYDQWLRLWMLEKQPQQRGIDSRWQGKFSSKKDYEELLETVFTKSANLMTKNAMVYVRTDARKFTFEVTHDALKNAFPRRKIQIHNRPFNKATQTALYGDKEVKPGEVDILVH